MSSPIHRSGPQARVGHLFDSDGTAFPLTPHIELSSQPPVRRHNFDLRNRTPPSSVITLPDHDPHGNRTGAIITRIEDILESVLDGLQKENEPIYIPYRCRSTFMKSRRKSPGTQETNPSSSTLRSAARRADVLRFPGRTTQEATKFASILRILELSHEALVSGTIITKRNVYYQNIELFRNQRVVDALVDDLAFTMGVSRDAFNIVAAAKGLVSGPIVMSMANGSVIPCGLSHDSGNLIPPVRLIRQIDFGLTKWILVIEKEATFRTLSASEYYNNSLAGKGILITAKGFPDLTTRAFLHAIHSARPQLPMHALVDYDPDGIAIMRTYKYGSSGLSHEDNAIVPRLQWLGIRSSDLFADHDATRESDSQDTGSQDSQFDSSQESFTFSSNGSQSDRRSARQAGSQAESSSNTTALTPRDRRVAVSALKGIAKRENLDTDELEQQRELQVMLMLNIKAEIQAVDRFGDITDWLDQRLRPQL